MFKDTSSITIMNTDNIRKETELEQHCSVLRQAENNFKVSLSGRTLDLQRVKNKKCGVHKIQNMKGRFHKLYNYQSAQIVKIYFSCGLF